MYKELTAICNKPKPFEHASVAELWNTPHIAKKMLEAHLNPDTDPASRNAKFMKRSIEWIIQKFNINTKTKILDLGCGPGLYTHELAKTGADVTGIDLSISSINYAKKRAEEDNLKIQYINANYLEYDFTRKFDLIMLIYLDFGVLNDMQRKQLLSNIYLWLDDGGTFLFDVSSVNHFDSVKENNIYYFSESDGFFSPNRHFVFMNTFKYDREKLILNKHTIIEAHNSFTINTYLKCFIKESIISELNKNHFNNIECLSNVCGDAYSDDSKEIALVARKR